MNNLIYFKYLSREIAGNVKPSEIAAREGFVEFKLKAAEVGQI